MLEVRDLSVSYGAIDALSDVSFSAPHGAITAVLGANGAGKTTLLRTMTGLVRARSGAATFDGARLTGRRVEDVARLGVSHVPEGRGVIEELSTEENLRLASLWNVVRAKRRSAIEEIYEVFPALKARRRDQASNLSGGQRQMLAIGRALISRPRLLLLDEPSLGLAPIVTAELMATLHGLTKGTELTVILVEQNARSALSVARDAVIINLGKVVITDTADTVLADANLRHHYLGF